MNSLQLQLYASISDLDDLCSKSVVPCGSLVQSFYFRPSFYNNNHILSSFLRSSVQYSSRSFSRNHIPSYGIPWTSCSGNGICDCECRQPRHMENSVLRCNRSDRPAAAAANWDWIWTTADRLWIKNERTAQHPAPVYYDVEITDTSCTGKHRAVSQRYKVLAIGPLTWVQRHFTILEATNSHWRHAHGARVPNIFKRWKNGLPTIRVQTLWWVPSLPCMLQFRLCDLMVRGVVANFYLPERCSCPSGAI